MLDLIASDQVRNRGLVNGLGVDVSETLPDIDRGYAELRPLFFGALGKLARQGFVTPPTDALDLIHDFFADEWVNLRRTYDPAKGSYRAYAYRAFVQFVRPRIVRMQRLQNYDVRPEEAESVINKLHAPAPNLDASHDSELLREKIAELPELQRCILQEYVYAEKTSERTLAKRFSLSRYKLRELLVDALGRVLVSLDKPSRMPEEDWPVAIALWKDARTLHETARYLGMTDYQVRVANKRNFDFLTSVLSSYQSRPFESLRRSEMTAAGFMLEPRALFKKAVLSPGDEGLLREIEDRAAAVAASLDLPDAIDIPDSELRNIDPLWIARLYEALAKADESYEQVTAPELFYAHVDAEYEIGRAYKESLIPGLPEYLADLAHPWLARVPEVDEDEMSDILRSPAAVGAEPLSASLARYGVTPLTVLEATDAVSRLVDRCLRTGRLSSTTPVTLSKAGLGDGDFINGEMLAKEISLVSVCREPTAKVLLEWAVGVAQFKPFLFNGFVAEPDHGAAVLLARTQEKMNDLDQRWGLSRNVLVAIS